MKVLKQIPITDANLIFSSVPENDYDEWDYTENYIAGAMVIVSSVHKVYRSLVHPNTNNNPLNEPQNDPDNLPMYWVEIGSTNRWQAFNGLRKELTVSDGTIEYLFAPSGIVDGIGIINASCDTVEVEVLFGGSMIATLDDEILYTSNSLVLGGGYEVVFDKEYPMTTRVVTDWYEFFFKPFDIKKNLFISDIPPYIGALINIRLVRPVGETSVGIIALGQVNFIGHAIYGAQSDSRSFSRTEPNSFGITKLVKRPSKLITRQTVYAPKAMTTYLSELREELDATVSIWSTIDDVNDEFFNAYIVNGIADRFIINADNYSQTVVELELREI